MEEKPATDELTSASIIEERGGVGFEPTTGELVRESWSQKIDFFLSCVGYAVGIGNVWRFPYLCYRNGGGAFLVPYLLMLFICGIPLFFMEMGIGQFTSSSALRVFRISPIFKGVGWTIVFVNWVVISYYDVLLAYAMYYFALSFSWDVPWRSCNNTWNTIHCSEISLGADGQGVASSARTALTSSPSEEFFQNYVLRISGGIESYGSFVWPLGLAVVVTWFVVFLCIIRGVRSVGKVVYFTATFPYVMLLALLIRGATLPGAADGIKYYIYPDWPKLKDPKVWVDAAIQIFYSLGPGWGGLITMASYNKFQNNIKRDSIIVPILNCGTSIFAGFVVFSVLGFMAHTMGVPVAEVATQGPSLAFVTYPQAVALMPFSSVWAVMFFFMLITLGLDTVFVEVETMLACILDDYPRCRPYRFWINVGCCSFLCACSLVFCFEGGIYLLTILDYYSSGIPIVLVCLLETIVIMYIYGMNKFNRDIQFMVGERLNPVWRFLWGFCTPLALVAILVAFVSNTPRATYGLYAFPDWAIALGWTTGAIAILLIPGYVVYAIWASKGTVKERATSLLFADASYGPAQKCDWEAWHAHCLKQEQIGIFKWMSQRLNWLLRRRR